MPPLTAQDPAGNVPLLVYRLVEHVVAPWVCPREWPVLSPWVERAAQAGWERLVRRLA